MSKFKDFVNINEEKWSDYNGMTVMGQFVKIKLEKAKYNNLMELKIEGNMPLIRLKSAESIKDDYNEKDWVKIEKIWAEMTKRESARLEKVVDTFEKELNKIVIDMEKEMSKF